MAFDDVAVASDGTVPFRTGERIAFSYLISTKVCLLACVCVFVSLLCVLACVCLCVCLHVCDFYSHV